MTDEPRAYTDEEVRDEFLQHCAGMVRYWLRVDTDVEGKMTGLMHSILATVDGCNAGLPGFVLAPAPHPDDEVYHRATGDNWYPLAETEHDIAGSLHDHWYPTLRLYGLANEEAP